MNVAELMHKLSKLPPHYEVVLHRGGRGNWRGAERFSTLTTGRLVDVPQNGLAVVEVLHDDPDEEEDAVVLSQGAPIGWRGSVVR